MKLLNNNLKKLSFVKIQTNLNDYRYAGKVTSECLSILEKLVSEKTTKTLIELDCIAEDYFLSKNTVPVFKGYGGFPATVCISVNKQLVHAIPSDYRLKEGDLVTFDTGCNYNGAISDSAVTCIFGEPKELIHKELVLATQNALYNGIKSISINNRIGAIGNAVFHSARKSGFKVIEAYTGHGISLNQVHSDPIVLNKADPNTGVRFKPGMIIAIEPLLVIGNSIDTKISDDKWTVIAEDISSHAEHSLLIHDDSVEILTWRESESEKIQRTISFN